MSRISVSPATEAEAPAALALIGRTFEPGLELLVARQGGELAGAAGVSWRHPRKVAGFGLSVCVRPSQRRRGVGRALLRAAADLTAGETPGLWSQLPVDEGSAAAAFAEACGFAARLREHHFCFDAVGAAKVIGSIEQFLSRRRTAETAKVVPLRDAPLEEAAWLLSAEFGDGPGATLARLRAEAQTGVIDLDRSSAVMADSRLAAFSLAALHEDVLRIEAIVVAPQWRGGWASMLLLNALVVEGRRAGATAVRFHCTDEALFTLKLARRLDATCERVTAYYFRGAS